MKETQPYFGDEAIQKLEKCIASTDGQILIVRGKKSFGTCGAASIIHEYLHKNSKQHIEFSEFANNPQFTDLEKGLALLKDMDFKTIVAVGGGSVIDMAKLLRFFITHEGMIETGAYIAKPTAPPSLIAIPTTAGSGSETTHFAVIYKDNIKYSVEHTDMAPDYALIYPMFTYDNPQYLTACSGFDAFAQSIEAYWNKNATEETDRYALKALELLYPTILDIAKNSTVESRNKMSEGAYWAGKAINITKTTAPHAFSYPFTTHYGYPHGHAVALTFPAIAEYNFHSHEMPGNKKRMLAAILKANYPNDVPTLIQSITDILGLRPSNIQHDPTLLMAGINPSRLSNNPASLSMEDCIKVLNDSIGKNLY